MDTMSSHQIGFSGELLAASLLQRIFPAIAFPQTVTHYDIICESKSGSFLKCQVKTTNNLENTNGSLYWRFGTNKKTKGVRNNMYLDSDVDFFAFVCLKKNLVIFVEFSDVKSCFFRIPDRKMNKRNQDRSVIKLSKAWNT